MPAVNRRLTSSTQFAASPRNLFPRYYSSPTKLVDTTVMSQRALATDEILGEITTCLGYHRSTLVSLACCAKSFEEPVLRVLWRAQDDLGILIRTLPLGVWVSLGTRRNDRKTAVCDSPQLRLRSTPAT